MKGNEPANSEEKRNDEMLRKNSDKFLTWEKMGKDKVNKLKPLITKLMKEMSC